MLISGQAFQGETISLDGQRFDTCDFMDCVLVMRGDQVFQIAKCRMFGSQFRLEASAVTTVNSLRILYNSGDIGRQTVEQIISLIREPFPSAPASADQQ
jgi:prophage tail gpP-like protein